MNVELINVSTDKPLSLIGEVAGISYGKTDPKQDRARRCWFNDHMSVFEHVTATWRVTGISRACSHQLVRHRLASYCQKSQRYTKIKGDDWYVVPLSIRCSGAEAHYHGEMRKCREHYDYLLDIGVKPEDARFALPEATKTDIVVTMNLREFRNFCSGWTATPNGRFATSPTPWSRHSGIRAVSGLISSICLRVLWQTNSKIIDRG